MMSNILLNSILKGFWYIDDFYAHENTIMVQLEETKNFPYVDSLPWQIGIQTNFNTIKIVTVNTMFTFVDYTDDIYNIVTDKYSVTLDYLETDYTVNMFSADIRLKFNKN